MKPAAPVLGARDLSYRYPQQGDAAIDGVSFELWRGRGLGLLGPNGAGKSTLINLLLGLRQPQRGDIRFASGAAPVIGWVPQEYAFYPDLSCRENLQLFARMLELDSTETQRRVEASIADCMLQEFAARRARQCSGGVRRRLNLAIALLQQPDVLLLDEPTVGIDPQSRAFVLDRIRLLIEQGTAVLYATHYMEEVTAVCSHILLLDRGRVVASGDLQTLLGQSPNGERFANLEQLFMHHTQRHLRD